MSLVKPGVTRKRVEAIRGEIHDYGLPALAAAAEEIGLGWTVGNMSWDEWDSTAALCTTWAVVAAFFHGDGDGEPHVEDEWQGMGGDAETSLRDAMAQALDAILRWWDEEEKGDAE